LTSLALRISDNGPIRGLWFHDRDFMLPFVSEVRKIYKSLNVPCDGEFSKNDTTDASSGKAILQMIQKESTTVLQSAGSGVAGSGPVDFARLLRSELDIAASQPVRMRVPDNASVPALHSVATPRISPEQLRNILCDMIGSDAFVNELAMRLDQINRA
jgi:hypothetical protein